MGPPLVLIVEDDEPTQKLLEAIMSRAGLRSLVADNGLAAINLLDARDDIACLILDIMMPSVDGMAVIEHLSAKGSRVPVIVCTAAGRAAPSEFDRSVVRAVVRKPFDIEQLTAAVTATIGPA